MKFLGSGFKFWRKKSFMKILRKFCEVSRFSDCSPLAEEMDLYQASVKNSSIF